LKCDKSFLIFLAFDGNSNEFTTNFESNKDRSNPNSNKKQNFPKEFFGNIRDGFKEIFNFGIKLD